MVSRALIPVAGLGTRLYPITRVVPKALLPLADASGRVRPVVHWICAEAAAAGIGQVGLVVSPSHAQAYQTYLEAAGSHGDTDLPEHVEIIVQEQPRGFGDAVLRGIEFLGGEPFVVLLGDHVHVASGGADPCIVQVARAYERHGGVAMVGMRDVPAEELRFVGVARGESVADRVYRCTDFVEKPDVATARARLRTEGLADDMYLGHCGIYVFGPEILDCLAELASQDRPGVKELGLSDAQSLLLRRHPGLYYLMWIDGRDCDIGTPGRYAKALQTFMENGSAC